MLNRSVRAALLCAVMAAGLLLVGPTPAAAQDCDDPLTDPTWVALNCPPPSPPSPPPPPPSPPPGAERRCFHLGTEVECEDPSRGTWVGDLTGPFCIAPGGSANDYIGRNGIDYDEGACGIGSVYQGCYRASWGPGAGLPPPDEVGPDVSGGYYILNCMGTATNGGLQYVINGVWLGTIQTIDPEEFAYSLLAQLGLSAPDIRMSPPSTGSVLLRMPLWLSTADDYWDLIGPEEACHASGVCVGISAQAVSITWEMGDGAAVTCDRDQNVAWQRGMDFLSPRSVNACHHYYQRTSRDQSNGRFQVVATTTFRAEWWVISGAASQDGVFDNQTDVCGPDGNALCQSTAAVQVVELQVLTGR